MYSSCLVCHHDLGNNEHLEHTPVGKAISFDPQRGRLWIICRRCYAWNLVPLEERWESIEECTLLFEKAPRRFATDHIGIAEPAAHFRLIRVANAPDREFAAWRYGRRLSSRRFRAGLQLFSAVGAVGSLTALGAGLLLGASVLALTGYVGVLVRVGLPARGLTWLPNGTEEGLLMRPADLKYMRITPGPRGGEWGIDDQRGAEIDPSATTNALSLFLPLLNWWPGSRSYEDKAVHLITASGGANHFLKSIGTQERGAVLSLLPRTHRLAIEMCANEDVERRALEGELRLLTDAWRRAEQIAAISDALLVPLPVEQRYVQMQLASKSSSKVLEV